MLPLGKCVALYGAFLDHAGNTRRGPHRTIESEKFTLLLKLTCGSSQTRPCMGYDLYSFLKLYRSHVFYTSVSDATYVFGTDERDEITFEFDDATIFLL